MKIAAISDTHGYDFELPTAEMLIHAGDMTARGEWPEAMANGSYISSAAYDTVILVPGNHDWCYAKTLKQDAYNFPENFHLLVDQVYEYQDHVFYGSPWTPPFMNWAFMRTENELRRLFRNMPAEIDVLITHGPPAGVLDNHCGSVALREAIEARKIHYHVFGHIHECGGRGQQIIGKMGEIDCYNVSALGLDYRPPTRAPRMIQLV